MRETKTEKKESKILMLDNSRIKDHTDWRPKLNVDEVEMTANWYSLSLTGHSYLKLIGRQKRV